MVYVLLNTIQVEEVDVIVDTCKIIYYPSNIGFRSIQLQDGTFIIVEYDGILNVLLVQYMKK